MAVRYFIKEKLEIDLHELTKLKKQIESHTFNHTIIKPEADSSKDSFLYSGLSLREALVIPYLGSTLGSTVHGAFKNLFNSSERVLDYHHNLNRHLTDSNIVKIANSVWISGNNEIKPNFENMISNFSEIRRGISQKEVNAWVSEKTEGMITSIPVDDSNLGFVIINALYFAGKWKHKFSKGLTFTRKFTDHLNITKNVNMMMQENKYAYYENRAVQAISMDYSNEDFCMVVVLPRNIVKPEILSDTELSNIFREMSPTKLKLLFPKFTYENERSLLSLITDAGYNISDAPNFPTFDRMSGDLVYISDIIQKTKIEVDEEGTKAAAVTAVLLQNYCTSAKEIIFMADHSFSFYIIHKPTFEILFTGVFNG